MRKSGLSPLEGQVIYYYYTIYYFESKRIFTDNKDGSASHTLPQRNGRKPNIIIHFANRKHKMEVLRNARNLLGAGVQIMDYGLLQ